MVRKLVIGGLVVVAVAVAGIFIYAWMEREDAPDELSLDDRVTTTTEQGAAPAEVVALDGTWTITDGSEVGYRVVEDFVGGITNAEAVGRTSDVTGSLTLAGTEVPEASFEVQMATIRSDEERRDNQFRGRIMSVDQFPTSTFVLTEPIDFGTVPPDGEEVTASATGDLTLRGTTKSVTFDVTAQRTGNEIAVNGSIPVLFSDYGIPNPSNPIVSTRDNGTLEFLLVFEKSA